MDLDGLRDRVFLFLSTMVVINVPRANPCSFRFVSKNSAPRLRNDRSYRKDKDSSRKRITILEKKTRVADELYFEKRRQGKVCPIMRIELE